MYLRFPLFRYICIEVLQLGKPRIPPISNVCTHVLPLDCLRNKLPQDHFLTLPHLISPIYPKQTWSLYKFIIYNYHKSVFVQALLSHTHTYTKKTSPPFNSLPRTRNVRILRIMDRDVGRKVTTTCFGTTGWIKRSTTIQPVFPSPFVRSGPQRYPAFLLFPFFFSFLLPTNYGNVSKNTAHPNYVSSMQNVSPKIDHRF